MKTKYLSLVALLVLQTACSGSDGGSSLIADPARAGIRSPFFGLPDLNRDYRPTGLDKKIIASGDATYAPMDFEKQNLAFTFDVAAKKVVGRSVILFSQNYSGRPYFEIKMPIKSAKLNGATVSTIQITDPDSLGNAYTALTKTLSSGSVNILEVEYELPSDRVTFTPDGVGFLTDMTDLSPALYFEQWGPANFEDDAFAMTMRLSIEGTESPHKLFANGQVTQMGPRDWTLDFPSHYTTSSFFVHLTNRALTVKKFAIPTQGRSVPVTVYSSDAGLVENAANALPALFSELEADYGPYPHDSFIAYMHWGGGGMEYVGATITSFSALDHELFHSWFARGVMPAEGRSGWIDEAFASWRDNGYFKADTLLKRAPTKLAAFSPFRKSTPDNCYSDGRKLIAELDVFLSDYGGMKPLMREFHERYRYRVVTTEEFIEFLEGKTGKTVDPYFNRYVYGMNESSVLNPTSVGSDGNWNDTISNHPSALTEDEVKSLR